MSYLNEFIQIYHEISGKWRDELLPLRLYDKSGLLRNLWVIYGKKAIREFLNRHSELSKEKRWKVSTVLNAFVMKAWNNPEVYEYYDTLLTQIIEGDG